jgi:hypothetical protein
MLILIYYVLELISCELMMFSSCVDIHKETYFGFDVPGMLIGK